MTPDDSTTAPAPTTAETPPMVRPAAGAVGDLPVNTGPRRVLGVKAGGRHGDFYFVASSSPWAPRRYARRFPLDQAGWEAAWQAFAAEDPVGAQQYLDIRAERAKGTAQRPSHQSAPLEPAQFPLGWAYLLCGFIVGLVGIILVHAGLSYHNSGLVVFAFITLFFGLLLALIGVVAEGIRVAEQQRDQST